jgi:hypothetical protein
MPVNRSCQLRQRDPMLLTFFLFCNSLFAQSSVATSEITGQVMDPSTAVVPEASVKVTNSQTGFTRTVLTDDAGGYRILSLPPGSYVLHVMRPGFSRQELTGIQLTIGQTAVVDVTLQIGPANETITVAADQPFVEIKRTQQADTFTEAHVRNLPIDRRDYLSFTLLAPGVADSKALADNTDYRIIQTQDSGLSFYGSAGRGNSVTVDGGHANTAAGGVRPTLSQEAVQEFEVNRTNYLPELGGASGGVINIVSKAGTNDFHGTVFGLFRHDRFDAAEPFAIALIGDSPERVKPPYRRQQYGGSLSFPVRRNRTFLFTTFEALRRRESSTVTVLTDFRIFRPTQEQTAIIDALAANRSATPMPCLPAVESAAALPPAACAEVLRQTLTSKRGTVELFSRDSGVFPFATDSRSFSTRLDHIWRERDTLFVRYNSTRASEDNQSKGALLGFSRSSNLDDRDHTVMATWTRLLSPTAIIEARAQWNYRDSVVAPNDPFGPELNIAGFGFFNRDRYLPNLWKERTYEVAESVTYMHGTHRLKAGGLFLG